MYKINGENGSFWGIWAILSCQYTPQHKNDRKLYKITLFSLALEFKARSTHLQLHEIVAQMNCWWKINDDSCYKQRCSWAEKQKKFCMSNVTIGDSKELKHFHLVFFLIFRPLILSDAERYFCRDILLILQ